MIDFNKMIKLYKILYIYYIINFSLAKYKKLVFVDINC